MSRNYLFFFSLKFFWENQKTLLTENARLSLTKRGGGDTLAVNKRHQKGKGEEKRELRSEERDRRELGEEGMRRKRQKRNNNQEKREVRMGRKL